ncbi:MAG: GntR family transcriptional regulator [Thermomicrobiaceae bacterium]|nr:GntR family transcriptional regulator [Thermomicrobiaceae bacterium]
MAGRAAGEAPLYQQIAATLRREIAGGVFRHGQRLPSEDALCARFGVSRITVRAALDQLADEGLVWRQRGKGTFVAERPVEQQLIRLTDFVEDMAAAGLRPTSRVTHLGEEPAAPEVARALGLQPGARVVRLDRLRLADDQPIAFDVTYLPLRYGRLLDRDRLETETIYHQLETQYGIPVVSGTFILGASKATPELASLLEVERGAPLLVMQRTSYTEGADPIYVQRRYYRADRVRYRLELTRGYPGEPSRLTEVAPVFEPSP